MWYVVLNVVQILEMAKIKALRCKSHLPHKRVEADVKHLPLSFLCGSDLEPMGSRSPACKASRRSGAIIDCARFG